MGVCRPTLALPAILTPEALGGVAKPASIDGRKKLIGGMNRSA